MSEPRPREFEGFLQTVTAGETRGVSHARDTSLHFPVVCYFALFIGKSLTARQEGGTFSAPDLAILRSALFGGRSHSLGAIIAYRLHINRSKGSIHGGVYATRLVRHLNVAIRVGEDHLLPTSYLDYDFMRFHDFIDEAIPPNYYRYNLVLVRIHIRLLCCLLLPCLMLMPGGDILSCQRTSSPMRTHWLTRRMRFNLGMLGTSAGPVRTWT